MKSTAIIQAVTTIFVGTDERDGARVQAAFAPQVLLDYTSFAGGEPIFKQRPNSVRLS